MERLSDAAIEIVNELHRERLDYNSEYLPLIDALNRLAAYEDTGLEPEQVAEVYRRFSEARAIAEELGQKYADRADELLRAEAEGRLVVLPCKVGTPVYRLEYNQHDGYWIELREFDFRDVNVFGETVFFTREEAEEKQKQKNEKWTRLM